MNIFYKLLHLKATIAIILVIVSIPNSIAQYSNTQKNHNQYYKFEIQNFNPIIKFSSIYNFPNDYTSNFTLYRDSLQIKPFRFDIYSIPKNNYIPSKWFNCSFENTDTLHFSIMNKQSYNLAPPNINYHYSPNPTTFQGLGILFMGLSRTILFPTAPDYKYEDK